MIRAILTAVLMVVLVLTVGTTVLVAGLVYRSRWFFALCAAFWAKAVLRAAGVRLAVVGGERLADGRARLFVANHQSSLDIPIMLAALDGNLRFMAKRSLFRIPLFGWILRRWEFVPIDRASARTTAANLDRMLVRLRRSPISFVIFPEGTRSYDGSLLPFRRGSMKVAQRCGMPVVPVTIDGSFSAKPRNRFVASPGEVRVVLHEPLPAEVVAAISPAELHERIVGTIARELGQPPPIQRAQTDASETGGSEPIGAASRPT